MKNLNLSKIFLKNRIKLDDNKNPIDKLRIEIWDVDKTLFSKSFKQILGRVFVDLDKLIANETNVFDNKKLDAKTGEISFEITPINFGKNKDEIKEEKKDENNTEEKKESMKLIERLNELKQESEKLKLEFDKLKSEFGTFFKNMAEMFSTKTLTTFKYEGKSLSEEELIKTLKEEIKELEESVDEQKKKYQEFNMSHLDSVKNAKKNIITNFPKKEIGHDKRFSLFINLRWTVSWNSVIENKELEEHFYAFLKQGFNQ
jgi:hypothetical protein